MSFFKAKNTIFDRFEELNIVLLTSGEILTKVSASFPKGLEQLAKEMHEQQKRAKQLSHDITDEVNQLFVAPLDREDLHSLAIRLEDILDHAEHAVRSLLFYNIQQSREPLGEFCTTINEAIIACITSVRALKQNKKLDHLRTSFQQIRDLEAKGDELLASGIRDLFLHESDAREIIKWKDIFQSLEKSLDRAEDTTDILEGILIKNS